MASRRLATPIRGVTYQLTKLSIRHNVVPRSLSTSFARSITTSTSSQVAVSPITTSVDGFVPIKPFDQQTVLATIHQFPSLEPLRFESYPANHLNLPTRKDILHRAVVYEGDMTRLGTASTKTRYEVRGSRRKVRPQKGTGRARLGDKKSPMLRGGGVAHGPRPRDFSTELQKKVYDLAWRTALSYRFRKGELIIVDNPIEIESPSSRLLNDIFRSHEKQFGKGRSLFVTVEERPLFEQALDELDRSRQSLTWEEVDVKDLLELSRVVIERRALNNILLSHQEDLTHAPVAPWHRSFVRSSTPEDLESIIGWQEFRDLRLAPASEQDIIRPDAYESVAVRRHEHAQTLPEGPEKQDLLVAAYELLAEAKELRRAKLPSLDAIQQQINIKSALAIEVGKTEKLQADQLELEIRELVVKFYDIQVQGSTLDAQSLEHRSEALEKAGKVEEGEEVFNKARGVRTDVANYEAELLNAKYMAAQQRGEILTAQHDKDGANAAFREAEEWRSKHEAKLAENEMSDESEAIEEDEALMNESPTETPEVETAKPKNDLKR